MAAANKPRLSVIMPALDEAAAIAGTLSSLQSLRALGHEVIVVDGGSSDATVSIATPLTDHVIHSASGRARQMRAGAAVARGEVFWFLHADTRAPADGGELILSALAHGSRCWGRFDVELDDDGLLLACIGRAMNLRSRLTGIATGDQGMFMTRAAYERIGGFADIPLMEDIAASRALRRLSRPLVVHTPLHTSARRWRQHGVIKTVVTMWGLRLAFFLGVPARQLARYYAAR